MENKTFSGRIDCIQILRVIASIGVMLFHIQCFYKTGLYLEFGVHLFFIISGFLMVYTTQKKTQKYFIIKRIIRIVPLYWLMTWATYAALLLLPGLMTGDSSIEALIKSLFLIPHSRSGSRIDEAIRPLVGPAWTLYYEMFFTVIFAISMKISHKYRGIITGGVCLLLIIIGLIFPFDNEIFIVYTRDYWADFIVGIVVFYILKALYDKKISAFAEYSLLAGSLICMGIMCWGGFPEPRFLIFAALGMFTVVMFVMSFRSKKMPVFLVKMGDMSYSFYLIHYYVIIIVGKIVSLESFTPYSIIGTVMILILTQILAFISYSIIEVRFSSLIKKKLKL